MHLVSMLRRDVEAGRPFSVARRGPPLVCAAMAEGAAPRRAGLLPHCVTTQGVLGWLPGHAEVWTDEGWEPDEPGTGLDACPNCGEYTDEAQCEHCGASLDDVEEMAADLLGRLDDIIAERHGEDGVPEVTARAVEAALARMLTARSAG